MPTKKEIQEWLIVQLAELLQTDPGAINVHESFSAYGLSSLDAAILSGDLEEFLGRRLSPTLVYDHPNIAALCAFLAGEKDTVASQPKTTSPSVDPSEPIAVIGMSCRFPGANNPAAFWQLLKDGVDAITEVPKDRWNADAFYHPDPDVPGKSFSRWGGFLDSIDQFDPFFFGISPVEAKQMDPQQRLLMELSYEALDDAGQAIKELEGSKTGVFIGITVNEYSQFQFGDPVQITAHSGTGSALSIAANRLSYFYHFRGPSLAIDTACSSSLTAVHLACQSLRNGECTMALAGGVSIILSPAHSIAFTKAGVLSPDGRCKTFDSSANGYVRGEGGGIVVLKPLSKAIADGDPVQAVILGSAVFQDGRTNGLMSPSREAQEMLLREACRSAGVSPNEIQYVEAHGTGTLLGDTIEAQALGAVLGKDRTNGPCAMGSVKTNIGHLEPAAGIAGLIKVILSLRQRAIPPSIHYRSPNPHIPFDRLHLFVNDRLRPWSTQAAQRLAGVSSFGFGGTNVHVVVREAGEFAPERLSDFSTGASTYLLPLSADNPEQLGSLASGLEKLLAPESSIAGKDICSAAAFRRSQFHYRLAVVGQSREEFSESLQAFLKGGKDPHLFTGNDASDRPLKLAFVFPGQGGQWQGMGRELLKQEPVFADAIAQISKIVEAHFSWSLMDVVFGEGSASRLEEIEVVQPALFAIQVALARLWQSWGITPDAVVGHSMGEIAAAHVAGILGLEEAIQVVCRRSQLLTPLRGQGLMLATELSVVEAAEIVKDFSMEVSIAAINSPSSTVLSGKVESIEKIKALVEHNHRFCKVVTVDVASHSAQMDDLRSALLSDLRGLAPQAPGTPFYSTVTGGRGDQLAFTADYWMDNLRKPVLFSAAVEAMLRDDYSVFIEIGPHPVLLGSIQQSFQTNNRNGRFLPSMRRQEREYKTMLETLAALYVDGRSIGWEKLYQTKGKHVSLPPFRWQRQRYWLDTPAAGLQNRGHGADQNHPLLGVRINLANSPSSFVWQVNFDETVLPFLKDHRIENEIVFPAAGYFEMALQCGQEAGLTDAYSLCDFVFRERLILQREKTNIVQTHLSAGQAGSFDFRVYSRAGEKKYWVLHASARFLLNETPDDFTDADEIFDEATCQQSALSYTAEAFYHHLQTHGLHYGPSFQGIQQIQYKDGIAKGLVQMPAVLQNESKTYQLHPALLDACLQVLAAIPDLSFERSIYLPTACKAIRFYAPPDQRLWSRASVRSSSAPGEDILDADVKLFNHNGQKVASFIGFRLQRTGRRAPHLPYEQNTWLYQPQWQQKPEKNIRAGSSGAGKHWFILADDKGLGEELAMRLEAGGSRCYLCSIEELSAAAGNVNSAAFIDLIENRLNEMASPPDGVVHLWSFSAPTPSSAGDQGAASIQNLGCESTLALVQVLVKRMTVLPRLWLVTTGAQPVVQGEPIAVEQSALWGLGNVICFELPEFACIRIDLDPVQSITESAIHLAGVIAGNDREDQVAYRAGIRYVHRLLPFDFKAKLHSPAPSFRADGTYLITGGLGGLGLKTAEWMAERGAKHLVLSGRSKPSPTAIAVVKQVQQQGVDIVIEQVDVSDPKHLKQVIENINVRMPVLRGIIHAAGVLDDGALLNLNNERMRRVMAPKVAGTWNLHEATAGLSLDFFVLFSSAVSVLGSPGQGNYAAASAYLDAFTHFRRSLGLPAISINWGPWADVGLAAEAKEKLNGQNGAEHLIKVIQVKQGLELLGQLLTEATPQVMVLPFDLKNLIALYPTAAGLPFLEEVGGSDTHLARLYARPNLRQPYVAPDSEMERKLVQLWQQTLHIDRVGVHDSFFELGGDSVLAAQVLTSAQKQFGIRLDPQEAFKAFTVKRLAGLLESQILQKIEAMSDQEVRQLLAGGKQHAE